MMKINKPIWTRTFICSCFFLLIWMACGCKSEDIYVDGLYFGESFGYYSTIVVSVEVEDGYIKEILILSHEEPEVLATIVFEELPPKIIKKNSPDVDVISGATYTSQSVINAVINALEEAKR